MKVVYIIMTHRDPILLKRLCDRLTKDKDNYCFIHVDKKIDLSKFSNIKENEQVKFIKNREKVAWSAWSYTIALMNSIKEVIEYGEYDRFVFLQELDYPIKSNKGIRKFFEDNKDVEFISAMKIDKSSSVSEKNKFSLYWYMDERNIFEKIINSFNKIIKTLKLNLKFRKYKVNCASGSYDIYRVELMYV